MKMRNIIVMLFLRIFLEIYTSIFAKFLNINLYYHRSITKEAQSIVYINAVIRHLFLMHFLQ
jgi:hypothetical protein